MVMDKVKPAITVRGLLNTQVCVPEDWNDEQVEEFANKENPTGIRSKWTILKEGHELFEGTPERANCVKHNNFVHVMLCC